MTLVSRSPLARPDRFFIDGRWVEPSSDAAIEVIDSNTEEVYFTIAEAGLADMDRAVTAARAAFDDGPWTRLSHAERGDYLRRLATELRARSEVLADIWPRESGVLHAFARPSAAAAAAILDSYADLADDYVWEQRVDSTKGNCLLLVREPVGVVAAIVPWNAPLMLAVNKIGPALLAGCTVVLKASPEAPGAIGVIAECAAAVSLPPGVLNVLTADRTVSEALVRDARVDKVAFTGSTAAGRRIASIMGERIGRFSLELGGKSPGIVLDDADLALAAQSVAAAECLLSGQVCASLTRLIVNRRRHDEFAGLLADIFAQTRVGDAFDPQTQMGPLATARQRERVEGYVAQGKQSGARLVTGGGRPAGRTRGYFMQPTVFAGVDNSSVIAREEIFGPVLCVIPAQDDADAIRIANDTIYGLNAAVFTSDENRAYDVARQLRSGTVGHNGYRIDSEVSFGGFKQSGVGREGGREGLLGYLESKTVILDAPPAHWIKS